MNYALARGYGRAYGMPHVIARVKPETFQAFTRAAQARGLTRSAFLREILENWKLAVNPAPSDTASPIAAIPASKPMREQTGASEPDHVLQAIDAEREELRVVGPVLSD